LKNGVKFLNYTYLIETFDDTSDEPLSKKDAFELTHARNIQKMKGDADAYDKEFIQLGSPVHLLGVHALKFIKQSYNIRNKIMLTIGDKIKGTDYRFLLANNYWAMFVSKYNMSQYLLKNADLSPNVEYEAAMLYAESGNWLLLYFKNMELWSIPTFRLRLQMSVLKEIKNILDVIISIENDIIAGPPSIVAS
jgi:hypothetical protein